MPIPLFGPLGLPNVPDYNLVRKNDASNNSSTPPDQSSKNRQSLHSGLYRMRSALSDKVSKLLPQHRKISQRLRKTIEDVQAEIKAASDGSKIAEHLTTLMEQPFFGKPDALLASALKDASGALDRCPILPDSDALETSAQAFATAFVNKVPQAYVGAQGRAALEVEVKELARGFLMTNRVDTELFYGRLRRRLNDTTEERNSAQKMALDVFLKEFPRTVAENGDRHVGLLKQLVSILPHLEHSEFVDRSAQYRGLRVLEASLPHLSPDERAQILAKLANIVVDLGTEFSKRRTDGMLGPTFMRLDREKKRGNKANDAEVLYASLTFAVVPLAMYLDSEKQQQGGALSLLKRQLGMLRKDWSNVSDINRQELEIAASVLRDNAPLLNGTKKTTRKRFFNDDFVDPSKMPLEEPKKKETMRRLKHRLISPLTSQLRSVKQVPDDFGSLSADEKALEEVLAGLYRDARKAGLTDAFPRRFFFENLRRHTALPEFAKASRYLASGFTAITETIAYQNPLMGPKTLEKIMEMIRRLAFGDETFVREFVTTAQFADEDCGNNAQQISKTLTLGVLVDKARKGEDGLNDDRALLALADGMHRGEVLIRAAAPLISKVRDLYGADFFDTEAGAAVHIALGKKLGIAEPIEAIAYPENVAHVVTPEALRTVEQDFHKFMRDEDAFLNFLVQWRPLRKKLKENPEYGYSEAIRSEMNDCKTSFQTVQEKYDRIEEEIYRLPVNADDKHRQGLIESLKETARELERADETYKVSAAQIKERTLKNMARKWLAGAQRST